VIRQFYRISPRRGRKVSLSSLSPNEFCNLLENNPGEHGERLRGSTRKVYLGGHLFLVIGELVGSFEVKYKSERCLYCYLCVSRSNTQEQGTSIRKFAIPGTPRYHILLELRLLQSF